MKMMGSWRGPVLVFGGSWSWYASLRISDLEGVVEKARFNGGGEKRSLEILIVCFRWNDVRREE